MERNVAIEAADDFEFTVPLLIVGGGAAGCVAALAAHDAGVPPLLVERDENPSGTTGLSQGLFCAAGTRSQAAHGVDDSAEIFFNDIMAKTKGQTDPVIARAIAEGSGPCLEWLVSQHDLPWELDTAFRAVYGNSRLRVHGWPGRGGVDMIQLLHRKLADLGIDVLLGAKLVDIVAGEGGRAVGVVLERPGGALERIGCEALILASGGFAANHERVSHFMPEAAPARHNGHEGNQGDGLWLGEKLGGALADMASYQGYAMLTDPQGVTVPPGVLVEGGFLVNREGRRFVNEMDDIAGMVHPVMAQPGGEAFVIYDSAIEGRCAHIPETKALIELNAAKKADTPAALAGLLGIDAAAFEAGLAEAWRARDEGRPDAVGRVWGEDRPPSAAFHAVKVVGAIYHTQGGLQIDAAARFLRPDGSSLPNLFAAGCAARGVSGPSSWGYLPAMGLCAAVTLGMIAGRSAAALVGVEV